MWFIIFWRARKNDSDLYAETIERNRTVHNLTVLTSFLNADE